MFPVHAEQLNSAVAERAEISVEVLKRAPEYTLKPKLIRNQAQCFDACDCQRHPERGEVP
jgi:hypothetical protein